MSYLLTVSYSISFFHPSESCHIFHYDSPALSQEGYAVVVDGVQMLTPWFYAEKMTTKGWNKNGLVSILNVDHLS